MLLESHVSKLYWSRIINLIIQQYLYGTTICILWNDQIEFDLKTDGTLENSAIINICEETLTESLECDVVDFSRKREQLNQNGVKYNKLVEKLTMSIEHSHCESFLVFQDDIPKFVEVFTNASQYSIWRSMRNRFIFGYNRENITPGYFSHRFFEDQPNLLLIERENSTSINFKLKTNKFVGKRDENPSRMYLLNSYDTVEKTFQSDQLLFPDKTRDLMGREVVLATLDYRPYMVLDYNGFRQVRDIAFDGDSEQGMLLLGGTEAKVLLTFCQKYNCTVQIHSSDDWGVVYPNISGEGALGLVANRKAEITMVSMYSWHMVYKHLDMSAYLVRSGITCLVPAPRRLTSWLLPLQPFQPTLWAAVMACLVIEIVCLYFTSRFEHKLISEKRTTWFHSFKFAYVTTLKLLVSQSGDGSVKSISVRVFLLTCFVYDIIITSIYGGGLASILTIPSLEEPADTIDRMVVKQLKWAADSEAWVVSLRASDDPRIIKILQNFHVYTHDELRQLASLNLDIGFPLERLPFGHFAIEDFLTQTTLNRLKIMLEDIYSGYTVAYASRLWPLLERFDELTHVWHSSGLDKFWEWKIVVNFLDTNIQKQVAASMYTNFNDIGPVELGMPNFAGIIVVWVLGVVISMVVFAGELMVYRWQKGEKLLRN